MVKKRIIIAAHSDLRFDQRLQRISAVLTTAGYQVEMVGRIFKGINDNSGLERHKNGIKLWFEGGKLAYVEWNIRLFLFLFPLKYDAICSVDLDTLPACWLIKKTRVVKFLSNTVHLA